ncbi:MAG TPA: hypothetical protein VE944_04815 [Nostoc sp.]|uniref:hypothetical protein n=1 Tax=Nostoc sp. TaxID=1180 RepID=UPI002D657EA4|nr:hypothetical protein [Nostoc sp.]HYX13685.1 hypothetical protein [Nostoc sp.]
MNLGISDTVATKIWEKDNRRISRDDVQRAWAAYMNSKVEIDEVVYDMREGRDPPPEWVLVKIDRKVMKLVFVIFDDTDVFAHLVTAYFVDRKTVRYYEEQGGRIHG